MEESIEQIKQLAKKWSELYIEKSNQMKEGAVQDVGIANALIKMCKISGIRGTETRST